MQFLPVSGTFHGSLQSHLQYLVLMGNFGGSAVNEVWFPFSAHPHSRNRTTKTFFCPPLQGPLTPAASPETYISYCGPSTTVCQDRFHRLKLSLGALLSTFIPCGTQTLLHKMLQQDASYHRKDLELCSAERKMKWKLHSCSRRVFRAHVCDLSVRGYFFGSSMERKCD